ncbi:MAG: Peptidylprolyl isomerase, partial [Acidimicrobiaceae bacterium]|nr:Peptidylprolyl isomerase [Acidimicrobiaceae bacterium]
STFSSQAAKVGSSSISQSQLNSVLKAVSSDADFRCVVTGGGAELTNGSAPGSYSAPFAAQMLTTLVESRALQDELARRHLQVAAFARSLGTSELESAFAPGQSTDQSCTTSGALVLAGLPASVRRELVTLQSSQAVLAASTAGVKLSSSSVASWAKAHPTAAQLTCVSLADFTSQALAKSFVTQASKGANFTTLAGAAGAQAQSGCVQASALPASLATVVEALATGAVSAPASYNSGFVVFKVTSRKAATGQQAAALLINSVASKVGAVVNEALTAAQVQVDPAYGRWAKVNGTFQVIPHTGPAATLLVNPAAVGASTASTTPLG